MENTGQATKKELQEKYRKCWSPKCNSTAWFQDWSGWNWCIKHTWREIVTNETLSSMWFEIKKLRIRYPFK